MKGTPSFGKHSRQKTHIHCRRCGQHTYHKSRKICASCGFGASSKMRTYNWLKK